MFVELQGRLLVLLAILEAVSLASVRAACVCPEQCDCDLQEGAIDCANRSLQAIPDAINCTWPGIIKMQV